MKNITVDKVRNFVLAGHAGAGKTALTDRILYKCGAVSRLGSVDQGTSVSDFRPEEQERKSSIFASTLHCEWNDCHFFFCDTPGYADFCGDAIAAIHVTDMVILVVDAATGIGPGTVQAWKRARDNGIPRAFFINGLDREQADFEGTLRSLQKNYGSTVCIPFTLPVGAKSGLSGVAHVLRAADVPEEIAEEFGKCREALMDTVAESDEDLMLRYLDGESLSEEEISHGLHAAIVEGTIVPVFCGSVEQDVGIEELMNGIVNLAPNPLAGGPIALTDDGELDRAAAKDTPLGYVFKSVTDPFIGQLTYFRVYGGTFTADSEAFNVSKNAKERLGSLLHVNGKDQQAVEAAGPGEIVAVAKLKNTAVCDTLGTRSAVSTLPPIQFPQPTMSQAVSAAKKGDEDKLSSGLQRLTSEDPTLALERNAETRQMVLQGMGDQHLATVISRLQKEFRVAVDLEPPKVPYRETITAVGTAQYRHKKQTGGHGQFAEVHLRLESYDEDRFLFANEVVGGNIPRNYIPAVEKGVVEAMEDGPLAGCKVMNLRAVVYDGKFHAVDSSEMAFKIAARGAFREAMAQSKPILLEPIMTLRIVFPDEYMGDISGDLNSRRGRILGMDREEGLQVVNAEVPMAETFTYASQLRSITQGRGYFEMTYERYDPVPANLTQQIQAAAKAAREAAD